MRYLHYTITSLSLVVSFSAQAFILYADALYWQPSESVDWALTNSNITASIEPNQVISYKTIDFDFAPGYRIGGGFEIDNSLIRFIYTSFKTDTSASTEGNVISTFMPSKFSNKFYNVADVNFSVDLDMVDLNISKRIPIDDLLMISPQAGLRAVSIRQTVNTRYQSPINMPPATFDPRNVLEHVTNHFTGFGPTLGLEGKWNLAQHHHFQFSLLADILGSYLWGKWAINDTLYSEGGDSIGGVNVGKRDFGAFAAQGFFGVEISYKRANLKAGYEISDWFNQYQVFDNGSGTHTNDLVIQGLSLAFYSCLL
jgi:hypothetical protein